MATRSLGTLTLDLIAKIGGFETGMDRAARTADRKGREISKAARESAKATEEAWSKAGTVVGSVLAGFAGGVVFQKFIAETKQAEQEQAQLAAVVKSTGAAAGFSVGQLNDMAESMAKASTFGAGDINQAQTRLLAYTDIVGRAVPETMQAILDMSTRTGQGLAQSAETLGKAINVPSEGMTSLRKMGFDFGEDQIALAKKLEGSGRLYEAQRIVLAELESSYGGAAAAARNTFGGALSALQEAINDLLTGDSGSTAAMKESVEGLVDQLSSAEMKQAFQTVVGLFADLTTGVANAVTQIVTFGQFTGEALAKWMHGSADPIERLDEALVGLRAQAAALDAELSKPKRGIIAGPNDGTAELAAQLAAVNKQIADQVKLRADLARAANAAGQGGPKPSGKPSTPALDASGAAARAEAAKKAAKDKEAADKKAIADAKRIFEQGQSYIMQLNDQVAKVEELSTVEKILFDLQLGKVTLTHAQKDEAFRLGQQIDDTKKLNEQKQAELNLVMAGVAAQRELNDMVAQYNRAIAGLGLGNRARDKDAGRNQIDDKYSQDRRRLDDARREAMNNGKFDGAAQKRYDDELTLIENFKSKAIVSYEDYWARLTAGEANWKNGASEAVNNYLDQSRNVAAQTADMWSRGMSGMEDAIVRFAETGKLSFSDLARSIITDMIRIQARAAMSSVLTSLFGAWTGSATGVGSAGNAGYGDYSSAGLAKAFGYARGGYTGPGGKYEYAGPAHKGEVYFSQEDVARHGGVGAVEALRKGNPRDTGWAEGGAVGPYTALPQGRGSPSVEVNVHAPAGSQVEKTSRRGNAGQEIIDVVIKQAVSAVAGQLATDSGPVGQAMRSRAKMGM